jgi:hypothetical protein
MHGWTLALVLLASVVSLVSAPSAHAAATLGGPIPVGATGSLTIHTRVGGSGGGDNGGGNDRLAAPARDAGTPLAGVVYDVTRIANVDLRTPEGWALAHSYVDNLDAARAHVGATVTSPPTGADGTTVVSGLQVGLYLVHLDPTTLPQPTATTAGWETTDFLVTVPMLDPMDDTEWLFDVDIFPKFRALPPLEPTPPPTTSTPPTPLPTTTPPAPPTTVTAPPTTPPGPLAVTGAEIMTTLFVALALLGGGIVMAVVGSRRTRERGRRQ